MSLQSNRFISRRSRAWNNNNRADESRVVTKPDNGEMIEMDWMGRKELEMTKMIIGAGKALSGTQRYSDTAIWQVARDHAQPSRHYLASQVCAVASS